MARLMEQLKQRRSARELVDFIAAEDWNAVDADTRFIALHEINNAITKLRERAGLVPIDDALPSEHPTAFQLIKSILSFPQTREKVKSVSKRGEVKWLTK
jgi:hypothetical protein